MARTQQAPVVPHEHFVSEIIVSGEYYEDHETPRGVSAKQSDDGHMQEDMEYERRPGRCGIALHSMPASALPSLLSERMTSAKAIGIAKAVTLCDGDMAINGHEMEVRSIDGRVTAKLLRDTGAA